MAHPRIWLPGAVMACAGMLLLQAQPRRDGGELERGFRTPPAEARPHVYWLWLNGYVDAASAREDLRAMKDAGFGGVLTFDMGARGEKALVPPAGPAFLSPEWMKTFRDSVALARSLGLQVDVSVVSSWDLGGHWIKPEHASMGLYGTETEVEGGRAVDVPLPFPLVPDAAPKAADGKPAFWRDIAVLAMPAGSRPRYHDIVFRLDPEGVHDLREAVLDNGNPQAAAPLAATMTPTREFSVAVSATGSSDGDFREAIRGELPAGAGAARFAFPAGTRARFVRLRLLSGHDASRARWTLGEFSVINSAGVNVAAGYAPGGGRNGAVIVRGTTALGQDQEWTRDNLHDGQTRGARGVFCTAGRPPFTLQRVDQAMDVTAHVDREGRLRWNAPAGKWTILRYVCANTGEKLKVPSPNSDGWATDHLNPEATRAHMDYVIARLRETFGDLRKSGLTNLYLASYEVRGPVWSPGFLKEFQRRRGYDMTRYVPALFGASIGGEEQTARFLFDYRKTLGEVLVDAYYRTAHEAAKAAGLQIKSEAGGPGPPTHNVPVDALLAQSAVDDIQGEFWPFRPSADNLWVVKETASAGHIYGRRRVHLEAFTSSQHWAEGPQDLKASADRVFCEGGNHMVWHTWAHNSPQAGKPGWAYGAGTHVNRNVTWWPKVGPFVEYLSRASYLLQRGNFVGDVLYYYGDGGYRFVPPRKNDPLYGSGYDFDFINSDALLNRLTVRNGRVTLPDNTSYAVLVLPEREDIPPAVLAKIEKLVAAGATVMGPKPRRACGLEGYPASDARVREIAARLWHGRIVSGVPVKQVLAGKGLPPDFTAPASLDFTHRRDGATDIYFVSNKTAEEVRATATFRVANREPELWDPRTGAIERAESFEPRGKVTDVPLSLAPNGSIFVVFRRAARAGTKPAAAQTGRLPLPVDLSRNWTVDFEGGLGAPERVALPALISWTERSEPGVRFYSGTGRYRKTFTLPPGWNAGGHRAVLDLGRLWAIGEAWLNGKPLGIVWTPPFRVDCTGALREGENELVVEVINTWQNRLIGDSGLPQAQRVTRTNVTVSAGKPWAQLDPIPSGLMGPVRLIAVAGTRSRDH